MDFRAAIDLIIRELDEAREIMDSLRKYPEARILEIELAKSKCRNASELITLLRDNLDNTPPAASPAKMEEKKEPVIKPQDPPKETIKTDTLSKPTQPEPENREIHEKKKQEAPVTNSMDEKDPGKPDSNKPYVAPIIADTFSHLANRFNEQIGEKHGDNPSYSHGRHIDNLSEAIGVNDRFYYIREIFYGNHDAYREALARLDKAENTGEAREILLSYRKDKKENEALRDLLSLLKRKTE
jgi:hypothetical protein